MELDSFVAMSRFGLGRRLGEALPGEPRAWLRAQLDAPDPMPPDVLPTTVEALAVAHERMEADRARKALGAAEPAKMPIAAPPHPLGDRLRDDVHALLGYGVVTPSPFRERLVWFWTNHFNISARGIVPTACAGAYVRDAIRPNVTGRFSDMLMAVMRHPAMLGYLDQAQSAGPDSPVGERLHRGLNENLARECLELHTVGVEAGYTQQDVTNFAKILTGWSIDMNADPPGFKYRPGMHEPGEIEMMGQAWPPGEAGGVAVLAWLGTHPATYRHIARKLVCHFVADDPSPEDVRRVEEVLQNTGGDLHAAALALIALESAWLPGTKVRSPQDYVVACLRALGADPAQVPNIGGLVGTLGQGMFRAPFPIGWPDQAADWAGPEALLQRVDFSYGQAARNAAMDPLQTAQFALGPLLRPATEKQMREAGSRRDAMTLFLASPEFMRR